MYILRITLKSLKQLDNIKIKKRLINLNKLKKIKNIKLKTGKSFYKVKNKNKIFTVLKSPHVNKKSREHFLYKIYTQKIDIKCKNIIQLFNLMILIKKNFLEFFKIDFKIIKL